MATRIDQISTALFEKLRARFEKISVGDEEAKKTTDPAKARFFNFDYVDELGNKFGNVSVSLIDFKSLKVYYGKNITAELDDEQKKEWFDFLRDLRMFAKRNLLSFDTRDISRSTLSVNDLKQTANADSALSVREVDSVTESKMYGSKKISYKQITPDYRLRIMHSEPINDDIHGARARKIHAVYVESNDGQRIKLPTTNLKACTALGRHFANGGYHNDGFGSHIMDLMHEREKLRQFIRGAKHKTFEDAEATDIIESAIDRFKTVSTTLDKLGGPRGYKYYKDAWKPAKTLQDDVDLEEFRSKFVVKSFDDRLNDALPHVAAAYKSRKKPEDTEVIDDQLNEFEDWANRIVEGTWALPDEDVDIQELQELMSKPLLAGIDGNDATAALYDVLGDDVLSDAIYEASKGSPELDVRPIVLDWLKTHLPNIADQVSANMDLDDDAAEDGVDDLESEQDLDPEEPPTAPQPDQQTPDGQVPPEDQLPSEDEIAAQMPPVQNTESVDLSHLKKLAGLI